MEKTKEEGEGLMEEVKCSVCGKNEYYAQDDVTREKYCLGCWSKT